MHTTPLNNSLIEAAEMLINDYPEIFSDTDISNYKKDLQDHENKSGIQFLTLLSDNQLVGIIGFKKDENSHNAFNIEWLIVKKGFEHHGLGSHLIIETAALIRRKGGRHLYLETSSARHNQKVKDFYEHLGFKEVGKLPDYFDHPKKNYKKLEDAIIYHKSI